MMISVLKLSTGEFIIAEHHDADETGSVIRIREPYIVDWQIGKESVPYIMLMRWMVGVRMEFVTLTKSSIVAIFTPTAQLEEQYLEVVNNNSKESDIDEDEVSDTDMSFLDELVEKIRERKPSLREEESHQEEIDTSRLIVPDKKTIH